MKIKIFLALFFISLVGYSQITISSGISESDINSQSNICDPFSAPVIESSGAVEGIDSYGTFIFTQGGTSTAFELTRGLILASGNLGQFNEGIRDPQGTPAWGGSAVFETGVGASTGSSLNATDLVFEFVALQERIDLSYVFGSNQYANTSSCISEGAAILIKRDGEPDSAYQNVAIVNGSAVTVATINRNSAGACSDANAGVLTGAQGVENPVPSVTRYTQALPAILDNLTIGETYQLRLVVSDVDDPFFDSVLFVEYPENNFTFTETATTSIGLLTANSTDNFSVSGCATSITFGFDDPFTSGVSYQWSGPSAGIIGATNGSRLEVNASGVYSLTINPTNFPSCSIVKTFDVTLDSAVNITGISDLEECPISGGGARSYDLRVKEGEIATLANNGSITQYRYFDSSNTLISTPGNYTAANGTVINVEVEFASGCIGTGSFVISEFPMPVLIPDRDPNNPNTRMEVCDTETYDINGIGQVDGIAVLGNNVITDYYFASLTSGTVSYFLNTLGTIPLPNNYQFTGTTQITARYLDDNGCLSDPVQISVTIKSPPSGVQRDFLSLRACGVEQSQDIYVAVFDLTSQDPGIVGTTVTYHVDQADAERETVVNEIANPSSYTNRPNATNSQQIFARIANNIAPDCPLVRQFEILPYFIVTDNEAFLEDLFLCEEQRNGVGLAEADFLPLIKRDIYDPIDAAEQFNIRILQGSPTGTELTIPATITTETFFATEDTSIFIEISSEQSPAPPIVPYPVCAEVYELKLYVDPLGTINTPTSQVSVCGDADGVYQGLVTEFEATVASEINTDPNIQLQYYATLLEAEAGINPISDATMTPQNTTPITYYVKGFVTPQPSTNDRRNAGNGTDSLCETNIVEITLNIEQEPELGTNPNTSIFVCSDSAVSLATFTVSDDIDTIVDTTTSPNITVTYHTTRDNAENNAPGAIDENFVFNQNTFAVVDTDNLIYVRIEDTATPSRCFSVVERPIIFSIRPETPDFVTADTATARGDDFVLCVPSGDPLTSVFDLSSKDAELIGNVTGRSIRYYDTQANAIAGGTNGVLNANGHPVIGTQIVWYRVENDNNPACNNVGQLQLRVASLAGVTSIPDITQCSSSTPGFGTFNLEIVRTNLVSNLANDIATVDFYRFEADAGINNAPGQEALDPIPGTEISLSPSGDFVNETAYSQEVIVRLTSNQGCVSFDRFLLIVAQTPGLEIENINLCVTDINLAGPIDIQRNSTNFEFRDENDIVVNPSLRNLNTIEYFEDATRSSASQIPLDDISGGNDVEAYTIAGSTQTIYTRVYFASQGSNGEFCFVDSQFDINLSQIPAVQNTATLSRCEDTPGVGIYAIDLTSLSALEQQSIYNGSDGNVRIRFYETTNTLLPEITSFTRRPTQNEIYAQAFIVRDNVEVCVSNSLTRVTLGVIERPELYTVGQLLICDVDTNPLDGTTNDNLNQLKAEIVNEVNLADYSIRFFDGATELIGSNYNLVNGNTYTALVSNSLEVNCSSSLDFILQLVPGPDIGNTAIPALSLCDTNADDQEVFNLTLVESQATSPFVNVVNYTYEYFTDASLSTASQISSADVNNYTVTGVGIHEIFVRLTSILDSDCQHESSFQIQLNGLPDLQIPSSNIDYCSNENIGQVRSDIVTSVSGHLSAAVIANLTFTLHFNPDGSDTALLDTDEITNGANIIYVKATDNTTSCESIQGVTMNRVLPPSIVTSFNPSVCDVDGVDDSRTTITLSDFNEQVFLGTTTELLDHTVRYFNDATDVLLTDTVVWDNVTPIRAEIQQKNAPNCTSSVVFSIGIQLGPQVTTAIGNSLLSVCNDDGVLDESRLYPDVRALEDAILNGQDRGIHRVTFFANITDAELDNNVINFRTQEVTSQTYVVKVRNTNTGCETLDSLNIEVVNWPEIGALSNNVYCENSNLGDARSLWDPQILSNIPSSLHGDYVVSYHTDASAADSTLMQDTDVVNRNTITVKLTNNQGCFSVAADLPIVRQDLPIINTLSNQEESTCDLDGITDGVTDFNFSDLNSAFLGTQSSTDFRVSYHSTMENADQRVILTDNRVSTGQYFVRVENILTGCYQTSIFDFVVFTAPVIDNSEIFICQGDDSAIINRRIDGFNQLTYDWIFEDVNGNILRPNESSFEIEIKPEDIGTIVTLKVTDGNTGCVVENKYAPIFENITPAVQASIEIINHFGNGVATVNVQEGGDNFTYELLEGSPVVTEPQKSKVFRNLLPGDYIVRINDENGCGPVDHDFTFVDYQPYFSPNDDGIADTWHVASLGSNYPGAVVYIHDRFGKLLATLVGDATWDGTYGGTPVPSDDYWILIEFTDRPSINDHITLKR